MAEGWDESAAAWLVEQGEHGDFGRRFVLDGPMTARLHGRGFRTALDVGCGEGRFCRIMQRQGMHTVGIDPTAALLERARALDPGGDYRLGRAETLAAGSFDLVVSYLSLIDIPDFRAAIAAMAASLVPGGTLLIANLTSFSTAGMPEGWRSVGGTDPHYRLDHYLEERAIWAEWRGIRVRNWHRPLGSYMAALLAAGLQLRYFEEPAPTGGDPAKADRYRRVPFFHITEWQKPAPPGC